MPPYVPPLTLLAKDAFIFVHDISKVLLLYCRNNAKVHPPFADGSRSRLRGTLPCPPPRDEVLARKTLRTCIKNHKKNCANLPCVRRRTQKYWPNSDFFPSMFGRFFPETCDPTSIFPSNAVSSRTAAQL